MIDRILRLTWRKALLVSALFTVLLLAHIAVNAVFRVQDSIFLLAAALAGPVWAICAAVYTFDNLAMPRWTNWARRR